jgi:signal transduction histidine kinase
MGLAPSIAGLQAELARPDVNIVFTHEAVPPNLTREVIVNAVSRRPGGAAQRAQIQQGGHNHDRPQGHRRRLTLTIADDGVGFNPDDAVGMGLGLTSMQERVDALGGVIAICSRPGAGTTLQIRVPVPPAVSAGDTAV